MTPILQPKHMVSTSNDNPMQIDKTRTTHIIRETTSMCKHY